MTDDELITALENVGVVGLTETVEVRGSGSVDGLGFFKKAWKRLKKKTSKMGKKVGKIFRKVGPIAAAAAASIFGGKEAAGPAYSMASQLAVRPSEKRRIAARATMAQEQALAMSMPPQNTPQGLELTTDYAIAMLRQRGINVATPGARGVVRQYVKENSLTSQLTKYAVPIGIGGAVILLLVTLTRKP